MQFIRTTVCFALAFAPAAFAAEETAAVLPDVEVIETRAQPFPASGGSLGADDLVHLRASTSDAAQLLEAQPGISLYGAGGVSSLPAIHGLADDRLRIKVDGVDTIASCPNHMNSPLSYVDPGNVGSIRVYAGIAPVSLGGDSIGGSIVVETPRPKFAGDGQGSIKHGEVGAFYRSNGNAAGANLAAGIASESFSMSYSGALARSGNYRAGGNFKTLADTGRPGLILPLDVVGSTAYNARNHALGIAAKSGRHLLEARIGVQDIPYELYPNQRMDLLSNRQNSVNLRYLGQLGWGALEARVYHEKVDHYMDFGADKMYVYGAAPGVVAPGMPMYTRSKTDGAALKADVELSGQGVLRIGGEYQGYRLDDWWPPSPADLTGMLSGGVQATVGGMAPNTFLNINGGKRDRLGLFGEWEARPAPQWRSLLGVRAEQVVTDTGPVQGYNATMMYTASSAGSTSQFNALDRKRTDHNIDLTALARYEADAASSYEFGFARKTRSPNLYERYSWSANGMALEMNNFVGDGNGYLGNPDLKPEVANTLSWSGAWRSADGTAEIRVTSYYTRVSNYIDAVRLPDAMSMSGVSDRNTTTTNGFVRLRYANQSARLYGVDISGRMPLAQTQYGDWGFNGLLNYTNGRNLDTGYGLYNIMPLNARVVLTRKQGGWDNGIEFVGAAAKDKLSTPRNEVRTPGYGLVNLRAARSWRELRVDFGIDNLFNRLYYLPLGGAYVGQGATMSLNKEGGVIGSNGGTTTLWGIPVPGRGRSINASVTMKF